METHPPISCVHLVNVYLLTYFGGSLCGCLCFLLSSFPFSCPHNFVTQSDITLFVMSVQSGFTLSVFPSFCLFGFLLFMFSDCQGLAFAAKVWSPLVSLFWVILTRHFEFFMFWFDFLLWVIFLICCCV